MPAPFVSRKILLVEDDDDLRRAYAAHLTASGFLVEEAEDVAAAHQIFRATRPDIAILDFRLPDGTALDLVPRFKELEPTIPIIVLTGFGSMELGVSLIKSGAEQCLAKPVESSALLLIVHKVLENSRNQQKQLANAVRRRLRRRGERPVPAGSHSRESRWRRAERRRRPACAHDWPTR